MRISLGRLSEKQLFGASTASTTREWSCKGCARKELLDGEINAKVTFDRRMGWDGSQTFTIILEVSMLKTVAREPFSMPVRDGELVLMGWFVE